MFVVVGLHLGNKYGRPFIHLISFNNIFESLKKLIKHKKKL